MTGAEEVRPSFRAFVTRRYGDAGRAWVAALPGQVEQLTRRWGLELRDELAGGALSYVAAVTTGDGRDAVVRIEPPWTRFEDVEAALRLWDGTGAPTVLAADAALHALLLERIRPGMHADPGDPTEVARLLELLHRPPTASVPTLDEVVRERIDRAAREGRASPAKADWALAVAVRLAATAPTPVLLHGDFDDRNLLICGERGLVAIDPLPCTGDPAYDAGHWVHANRRPGRRARLDAIVEATGLPRERVRDWAAVVGVHG